MKNIKLTLILLLLSLPLLSQNWVSNINDAKQIAIEENKTIVMVFSGSDWCAPCIKLEKKIWMNEKFQKLAKDSFVMLKVDFPRRKKNKLSKILQQHNDNLAEQYNKEGMFPLVVLIDEKGIVKGKLGYENISPIDYYKKLKSI